MSQPAVQKVSIYLCKNAQNFDVQYLNELFSISHVANNEQTPSRDMAVKHKQHQFLSLYIDYVLRISIVSLE